MGLVLGGLPLERDHPLPLLLAGTAMTTDYLLLALILVPFIAAGAVAVVKGGSLLPLLPLLGGAIGGLILMPISGTLWLQFLLPSTFQYQGSGIAFIAVLLPFFAFSGCVAGAWAIAVGYWYWSRIAHRLLFQGAGWLMTMLLGGFLPVAIARIPWPSTSVTLGSQGDNLTWLGVLAIANGICSAWLGCAIIRRLI